MRLALAVCVLVGLTRAAVGSDVPKLDARINDQAHLLSQADTDRLTQQLATYEMQTGRQFAFLSVPSLDDEPLEMFSIRVVEQWKLGRKGHDDGLLLLVALQERRMRIEVGYRLEPTITDALSSQVIQTILQPAFRAGAYGDGIARAFSVLMAAANQEPVEGLLPKAPSERWLSVEAWCILAGIFVYVIFVFIMSFRRSSAHTASPSMPYVSGSDGPDVDWSDGGGGDSGGDSFDGGGGGDFGGGGASGDW